MSAVPQHPWTEKEYLAFERESPLRHEYRGGQVMAMSGASRSHNIIASNINGILFNHLANRPCEHYPGDMRVYVPATELYTYPDVTVVCGEVQLLNEVFDTLLNPTIIFEILSPSTEKYDRGQKFQDYRTLASLQEYVLVSQHQARIEHYARHSGSTWAFTDVPGLESKLTLPANECPLPLVDVYRKVTFDDHIKADQN